MENVQEWIDEHEDELSLMANYNGMNKDEVLVHVLEEGLNVVMDEVSEMVINEY